MPVSHLALTVSHLPDAVDFYVKTLQPLGYRYIGQRGNAIGFGITDADFFLTQEENGRRIAPTHIAFAADSRATVRNCYTAALNARARRSGAPDYRNGECDCFNAAVEDLDGNTIEFIYRDDCNSTPAPSTSASSNYTASGAQPSIITRNRARIPPDSSRSTTSRAQTTAPSRNEERNPSESFRSIASKAQSTAQTALSLAASASRSLAKPDAANIGTSHSVAPPSLSQAPTINGCNAIFGGILGAAAGAALAYAMVTSERDNATEEVKFNSSVRSRETEIRSLESRSHKDFDQTQSSTIPSRPTRYAIQASPLTDFKTRETVDRLMYSSRPVLPRSRTYDAIDYKPYASSSVRSSHRHVKRAFTAPLTLNDDYKGDTRHTSVSIRRRRSFDGPRSSLHDSATSVPSQRPRRSSCSRASTSKSTRRDSFYESAANVPLPSSRATSRMSGGDRTSHASKTRSYVTAAQVPLPSSRTPSYTSATTVPLRNSKTSSYISGAHISLPPSETPRGYTDVGGESSDGLDDADTIVPDDSISCVDFSAKAKKKSSSGSKLHAPSKSSRHSSKHSEADSDRTIRAAKSSGSKYSTARTLPARLEGDDHRSSKTGRRSTATRA